MNAYIHDIEAWPDTALRNAKPQTKTIQLYDDGGLFVIVTPAGGKLWRMKYRFNGKEQLLLFGTYPDVSLKTARVRRDEARSILASGVDPREDKKRKIAVAALEAAKTFKPLRTNLWKNASKMAWRRPR